MAPASSVLFDGNIPTLTGLDGNLWACQLLTLYSPSGLTIVQFDFSSTAGYSGVDSVEVVMFNCPQLGITVQRIELTCPPMLTIPNSDLVIAATSTLMNTSCDSLVTVSMPSVDAQCNETLLGLKFLSPSSSNLVYIAEVRFCGVNNCPSSPSVTTDETAVPAATTTPNPTTASSSMTQCPSSARSTVILTAVITAIITALLATVVFVLVQIAVCKCHPKFTPKSAVSEGEGQAVYEQVDGGEKGGSDPTYVEVGAGGGGFELKENEAYNTVGIKHH